MTIDSAVRRRLDRDWIVERLAQAARRLDRPVENIDLLIVDDRRMSVIHERHLSDPTTTDVLSFDLGGAGGALDVQLVVCADVAEREATGHEQAVEREILRYAIHGLLHCAGFDDDTDAGYARMHAEEDRILEAIGVGGVFKSNRRGKGVDR